MQVNGPSSCQLKVSRIYLALFKTMYPMDFILLFYLFKVSIITSKHHVTERYSEIIMLTLNRSKHHLTECYSKVTLGNLKR